MIDAAARAGEWSDVVVVSDATRGDGGPLLGPQLATALAAHAPVLYIEPAAPRLADAPAELQIVQPGLAWLTPHVVSDHAWPGRRALNAAIERRALRRALVELGSPDVRALISASTDASWGLCGERWRVFYATDDLLAPTNGRHRPTEHGEAEIPLPPPVDLVVAATPFLAAAFERAGHATLLLPDGCDDRFFADDTSEAHDADEGTSADGGHAASGPPRHLWLEPPIVGFVGRLSSQVDVRYLDAVAARGHSLLLVGPAPGRRMPTELRPLLRRPNVAWIAPGQVPALPDHLRSIDLGLIPYGDSFLSHAGFPSQMLAYLAAGRPMVSTAIDAVRWLIDESATRGVPLWDEDLTVVDDADPEIFADAVTKMLALPADRRAMARRRAVARAHSWASRSVVLADALGFDVAESPGVCA